MPLKEDYCNPLEPVEKYMFEDPQCEKGFWGGKEVMTPYNFCAEP